ncbi:MAG: galactose-1-phosphate uridylyltransferase [Pyrinomonadaceae bacterium]
MTWEERWHPLREEWVVVAAHRQNRPWSGETIEALSKSTPRYEDDCYLCPGNSRVSGATNPSYENIFVFDNDHPSISITAPEPGTPRSPFHQVMGADGISRVVCYSPRHDLTLAELSRLEIVRLFECWQEQYSELGSMPNVDHVLVFENKGEAVGVSNPHPHCQIYANNFVFKTIANEVRTGREYFAQNGRVLFQDVIAAEVEDGRRIIAENDSAIAFVPYFARYAYEVFVAPKATHPSIAALSGRELADLSEVLKAVLVKFDNLWQMPFPYVMPLHQAPTDCEDHSTFHFHIEFHPPLRKPDLLKYLAGPEIGGGNFLSDTSPEEKAAELIAASSVHYKTEVSE